MFAGDSFTADSFTADTRDSYMSLSTIPTDVSTYILLWLPPPVLNKLARTNKVWKKLSLDNTMYWEYAQRVLNTRHVRVELERRKSNSIALHKVKAELLKVWIKGTRYYQRVWSDHWICDIWALYPDLSPLDRRYNIYGVLDFIDSELNKNSINWHAPIYVAPARPVSYQENPFLTVGGRSSVYFA